MARELIDFRSDFKLKVTFYELNPDYNPAVPIGVGNEQYVIVDPTEVPFVINLFSTNGEKRIEKTLYQATWDFTTATNFEFVDANTAVLVIFDNAALRPLNKGLFEIGLLHGTVWYGYPDSEMPDDTFNCGNPFDTNIDIINIDIVEDFETIVI